MALKMGFTVKGKHYPDAYWRIGQVVYDDRGNKIRVAVDMYSDAEAREADKENGSLFTKPFYMGAVDFTVFENSTINQMRDGLYQFVKNYKEGDPPPEDEDGNPLYPDERVSFFSTAEDVL